MCITINKVKSSPSSNCSTVQSILRIKTLATSINSCSSTINTSEDYSISSSIISQESSRSSPSPPTTTVSPAVTFDHVEIRVYNIVVGDNPSCSHGPPISLGWEYDEELQDVPLEDYEQHRNGLRRVSTQMKMPSDLRRDTLRYWDVPTSEIIEAQKNCEVIQKQRFKTLAWEHRKENSLFLKLIVSPQRGLNRCLSVSKRK